MGRSKKRLKRGGGRGEGIYSLPPAPFLSDTYVILKNPQEHRAIISTVQCCRLEGILQILKGFCANHWVVSLLFTLLPNAEQISLRTLGQGAVWGIIKPSSSQTTSDSPLVSKELWKRTPNMCAYLWRCHQCHNTKTLLFSKWGWIESCQNTKPCKGRTEFTGAWKWSHILSVIKSIVTIMEDLF